MRPPIRQGLKHNTHANIILYYIQRQDVLSVFYYK